MVDTRDSKSRDSDIVSVQVRSPVPRYLNHRNNNLKLNNKIKSML